MKSKPSYQELEKKILELEKKLQLNSNTRKIEKQQIEDYAALNEEYKTTNEELTKAKKKAEESEIKYRAAFYTSPDSVNINKLNGEYVDINEGFTKLTGFTREDVIGKLSSEIEIWAIPQDREKLVRTLKKEGVIENLESIFKTKYGKLKPALMSAKIIILKNEVHILSVTREISELKKFENSLIKAKEKAEQKTNELKEQQLLFQSMFNAITEGIVITDTDRKILMANKGMKSTFGYLPDEIIGKKTKILYADATKYIQAGESIFNKDAPEHENKYLTYYKNKEQNIFPGETFGAKLYNKEKQWIGNIGIIRDISEEVKFINDLKIARRKAEESDQLKTEFINNMSHEIRTPMNGILGFSKMLNKPNLSDAKKKYYVNIIQNSGNQLMRIIDDILEISKLETKQVKIIEKEVCLNDLLLEHFSIFDIKAKENKIPLYLHKGLSDKESIIFTDEAKLNKILSNLLENAFKFTNTGFIEFGYHLKGTELEIYVKDTGIGIKPQSQKIIFQRFSQEEKSLSRNVGGLGLGLSIAKENAELLGGKITLNSQKGKGATFFVTIPYKIGSSKIEKENSDTNNAIKTQKLDKHTILIVEDEEVNYLFLEVLLQNLELNITILHAKQGKEALEMCKENAEIDFVFMDMKMPIMNGFEASKLIKKIRPELTIVAQTAYSTDDEKERIFAAGCDDFISKPISEETLNSIINKYLLNK